MQWNVPLVSLIFLKRSLLLLLLLSRFSHVWLCATPQTAAHQAPPSLGFSRQEHWSGLPFPSPTPQFKASILWHSALFIVQLSHPYMTTGKTTALIRWSFVALNILSRLVITFLPRSKRLLSFHGCNHHLQWFWSPPKIKSDTVSTVSPSISHEVKGPDQGYSPV